MGTPLRSVQARSIQGRERGSALLLFPRRASASFTRDAGPGSGPGGLRGGQQRSDLARGPTTAKRRLHDVTAPAGAADESLGERTRKEIAIAMLIVEILIAVGIACIATALLGSLTDEGGDRLGAAPPRSTDEQGGGR